MRPITVKVVLCFIIDLLNILNHNNHNLEELFSLTVKYIKRNDTSIITIRRGNARLVLLNIYIHITTKIFRPSINSSNTDQSIPCQVK